MRICVHVLLFLFVLAGVTNNMDSVPKVEAICKEGGVYIGIVKTAHSLYPKKEIMDVMKTFPGDTHLVMESSNDNGSKMCTIGYKYSSKKELCFICSEGTGSTNYDKPYNALLTDCHSNVHAQKFRNLTTSNNTFPFEMSLIVTTKLDSLN
eukprot:5126046-Ditylum_brightwellii.AAC.2